MKLILLGTGTSTGIPEVGCGCGLCQSDDLRDRRQRTSALVVTDQGKRILIDCSPDFRAQALRIGLDRVDAVLLTHEHYDHIGGLDDMRTIAWRDEIPIYGLGRVLDSVRARLPYIFSDQPYPGTPRFRLSEVEAGSIFEVCGLQVEAFEVLHGSLPILGYKMAGLTYVTDLKHVTDTVMTHCSGAQVLVVNILRHIKPHPSHQSLEDLLGWYPQLQTRPERTVLTHLSHHAPSHRALEAILPECITPGYDYMTLEWTVGEGQVECEPLGEPLRPFEYVDCGRIPYGQALELQRTHFDQILKAKSERRPTQSYLLFCEHNPVFTLGKHGKEANLLISEDFLRSQGYELWHIDRGGDITYHGPGQLTGYPILDLEQYGIGLRAYIELMEDAIMELLMLYGISSSRKASATGVWLDADGPNARKICAIGVRSTRYTTMHGFALNVNNSLEPFRLINPCGFKDGKVTSMAEELGGALDFTVVKHQLSAIFYAKLRALSVALF